MHHDCGIHIEISLCSDTIIDLEDNNKLRALHLTPDASKMGNFRTTLSALYRQNNNEMNVF